MKTLVIVEHNNQQVLHPTLSTIQAASCFNTPITALVIGYQCEAVANEVAAYEGLSEVLYVDHKEYEYQLAENMAKAIVTLAKDYSHLLAPADTFGKNLMPRVAGLLGIGQISDITEIIDECTFIRPIYAGNALAKVVSLDAIKIVTIRTSAFPLVTKSQGRVLIEKKEIVIENKQVRFIDRPLTKSDRPELTAAKIVISGGRGLQNAENFKLLEQLADQLNAAIGASRAAVDAGFVPNDYQVGQTGKVVAPDLYFAIGISGAIQHVAGMKGSKAIVAINKDPDAPIFAIADYGLVGDLFKFLPELQQELSKLGYTI